MPPLETTLEYRGGKIMIGHWNSISKAFSAADLEAFARVSGDHNPVHLDERYAVRSMFLMLSLLSSSFSPE